MAAEKISVRELARSTKRVVQQASKGATLIITLKGAPVAVLTALPDELALRILPLDHPRVETILRDATERTGGTPINKAISQLREALAGEEPLVSNRRSAPYEVTRSRR